MTSNNINIVELLDEHIRLYAPVMIQLLEEFPEVDKAYNFIGREEPTAIPLNEAFRGYKFDEFQDRSTQLMKPLVDATRRIQKRCKATNSIIEPVSVHISKLKDDLTVIKAHVTNRMGGLYVDRYAYVSPNYKECIVTKPAVLHITTLASEDVTNTVKSACEIGFNEAVTAIKDTNSLFNGEWIDKKQFDMWLADFPADEVSQPSTMSDEGNLVVDIVSTHRPTVVFTSDEHFDRMKEMLGDVYVEKLEPITAFELGVKP